MALPAKPNGKRTKALVLTPSIRTERRIAQANRSIAAGRNVQANEARIARLLASPVVTLDLTLNPETLETVEVVA